MAEKAVVTVVLVIGFALAVLYFLGCGPGISPEAPEPEYSVYRSDGGLTEARVPKEVPFEADAGIWCDGGVCGK